MKTIWIALGLVSAVGLRAESDLTPLIANAGFESQNAFTGACDGGNPCYNYTIVDWPQSSGTSGTFAPALYAAAGISAYQGNNVAFLVPAAYIQQTLNVDLTVGTTYTISVAVAGREDTGAANYRLGVADAGFATFYQTSGIATPGVWQIATLTFVAPSDLTFDNNPFVYIATDTGGQLLVDAATPEPAPFALIIFGIITVFAMKRLRQV